MMRALILDTETTGLDAPELIEAAWLPIDISGEPLGLATVSRWKPSKPISLGALATHHIMDEDLADFPPSSEFKLPDGVEYLIGHNVDFDWRAIGEPKVKRIDVCAMCRALWPDADSHTQSAMLYLLEREAARERLARAHSAAWDVANCRIVLRHALFKQWPAGPASFEQLHEFSERCRIPTRMMFGKHKGMAIRDVPADYKRWLLGQPDVDPYLRRALQA